MPAADVDELSDDEVPPVPMPKPQPKPKGQKPGSQKAKAKADPKPKAKGSMKRPAAKSEQLDEPVPDEPETERGEAQKRPAAKVPKKAAQPSHYRYTTQVGRAGKWGVKLGGKEQCTAWLACLAHCLAQ